MASLKDTEQLAERLEEIVGQLRSELGNGTVDFEKLVTLSDELSEEADGLAETFNNVNQALMQRLEEAKGGRSGSRSKSSGRQSESSETKATTGS